MRIGLATLPIPGTREEAVSHVCGALHDAAARNTTLVCFAEAYVPGLRGLDFPVVPPYQAAQEIALQQIAHCCREAGVAAIVGMEWQTSAGLHIVAMVIDSSGNLLGHQAKNQLDPSEDGPYTPGTTRKMFQHGDLKFGIAICHEGWRYPETVRWAARRGAHIVFHPQHTGSDKSGAKPSIWGDPNGAY